MIFSIQALSSRPSEALILLAILKLQNSLIQQSCVSQQNLKQAFQSRVFKLQSLNLRLELSILKRLSPSKSRPTVNFKQKSTQHKNFKLVLTNSSRSLGLKSLTRDFNFNLPAIFSHDSQASPILKLQSSNSLIFQAGLQFQKTLSIFMLILELRTSNNSEPVFRTSNNSTSDSNLKEDFRQLIL